MRRLEATARAVLDRRLLPDHPRPIALALSGGGDSVALALVADQWARTAGRPLLFLTVDHGLQPLSAGWTVACSTLAARLKRPFHALRWTGAKPATGLPAAARAARHRLLAEAAREAGAAVLLMGHTADDILEAGAMRMAGATTPDPREWTPSPAWPEGRGLFLLRPLLDVRRAQIRSWLMAKDERWIDDPANVDARYARARARALSPSRTEPASPAWTALALADEATHAAGIITLTRAALRDAAAGDAQRFVGLASVCAGGGARRPATARLARAADALRGLKPVVATLAGARLEADAERIRIFREAGEAARGGLSDIALPPGRPVVWDGRFEVSVDTPGVRVRRLAGLARHLPPDQQPALHALPAAARGGLPALVDEGGAVTCPALTGEAESLVADRLRAAAGLVDGEPG